MYVAGIADASSRGVRGGRLRGLVAVLLIVAAVLGSSACGADPEPEQGSAADAYAVVVGWFVDAAATGTTLEEDGTTMVFVEPRGDGMTFGVDMQAEIISATKPFADVRFIDDRAEALDEEGVVREGSIFLALGPSSPRGGATTIECDDIASEDRRRSLVFELRWRGGEWVLAGEPAVTG